MKNLFFKIAVTIFLIQGFVVFSQENTTKATKSDPNVPIFEIKNDAGQTVFAVYPSGVKIFIDTQLKATGGGFTVGRLGTGKATGDDFFIVNPGEVQVILPPIGKKATGGGFTVGRLGTGKASGLLDNFLTVTPDSTNINISETGTGGFAIGKLGKTDRGNFLNLSPQNYFIGQNVAPNITKGLRNSVFGYYAGHKLSTGNSNIVLGDSAGFNLNGGTDNILIGNKAGFNVIGNESSGGRWNIFIGNNAGLNTTTPVRNIFIGYDAGRQNISGQYNLYVGDQAGEKGTGYYNTILGGLAATTNDFGNSNVILGYVAGRDMVSANNVFVGTGAGYNNAGTVGGNVFIGYYAGEGLPSQDNRLAISNRTSTYPLIYGEFDNKRVVINGNAAINGSNYTFYVNGTAGGSAAWNSLSDFRLKTDIMTIPRALDKVLRLRGVNFHWKDKEKMGDKLEVGFIAQEVERIIPEVVNKTNDTYSMQYAPITALLVEAIKEQQTQIETGKLENIKLTSRIQKLETKNKELSTEISKLSELKNEVEELKNLVYELKNKK